MGSAVFWLIPIVAIIGGFAVAIANIVARARMRELKMRERIAMIEKGLVPPPEVDPAGFDRAVAFSDRARYRRDRHRRGGITFIGVGLGVMTMLAVSAGDLRRGLGVGAFFVIFGLAMLVNSWLDGPGRHESAPSSLPAPPQPPTR